MSELILIFVSSKLAETRLPQMDQSHPENI